MRPKTIVEVNRAMLKTTKTVLFMAACFGVIFTSLSGSLFAQGGKLVAAAGNGENVWITDTADQKIFKLQASTRVLVSTYSVPSPLRLIYDGKNVWTTSNSGTVTKIQAKDGAILGSYDVGGATSGIAFDGENVWVSNIKE